MNTLGAPSIRRLVDALQATPLYRQYQQAFHKATGLAMMLRLPDTDHMPSAVEREDQSEFCKVMSTSPYNCGACDASRQAVKKNCGPDGVTGQCFAHMSVSALPVMVGENLIA